jgi:hypothetical protein
MPEDNERPPDPRFPQLPDEHRTLCPICQEPAGGWQPRPDADEIPCSKCGTYVLTRSAEPALEVISAKQRIVLSGFVRDQTTSGQTAIINSQNVRDSAEWPIPDLIKRADRMLALAIEYLDYKPNSRDSFNPSDDKFVSASYSRNGNDALRIARVLEELGYVEIRDPKERAAPGIAGRYGSISCRVTARGRLYAEEQSKASIASTRGFAAMWFDPTMDDAWRSGIMPAIADAGYDPVRIDRVEHLNRIDDEIMLQIRSARFVVADFTGHRFGVYFEAGFALGLEIPVIWTCRQDEMDKLHFDIRQYNCIDWTTLDDLRIRLAHRIEATVGAGPRKTIGLGSRA